MSAEGEALDPVAGALAERLRRLHPDAEWTVDRPGEVEGVPPVYTVRCRRGGWGAIVPFAIEVGEDAAGDDGVAGIVAWSALDAITRARAGGA